MRNDHPALASSNPARIAAADFAALFSEPGETDQAPATRTKGGLVQAAAALVTDSLRTLAAPGGRRDRPQDFARRAM